MKHIITTLLIPGIILVSFTQCQSPKKPAENTAGSYDRSVLPIKEPALPIYTQLDVRDATPPERFEVKAPENAPNIVIVLIDDMGFSTTNVFGGPIEMPTLDKLADNGIRYSRFHTTALCAPTRMALLTGHNHHSCNMGVITEAATTFPGYTGVRPQNITPMAEVLRQNGYNTAMFGKSHEVPPWEISNNGPQDRWPVHSGFEKFYGFLGGETNQWAPNLYDGVTHVELPDDPNYHFTEDMTDKAIQYVTTQKSLQPDKPFFVYYAPGATHAPHHVPKEWIDRFKGKFDDGWDMLRQETLDRQKKLGIVPEDTKLAPRPNDIKAWETLTADEKKLFSRQMEVYAAFAAHTDHQIGRLVSTIENLGIMDNTIFIYIAGDNGASAEGQMDGMYQEMTYFNAHKETVPEMLQHYEDWGSESTYPHFSAGWAVGLDAPFAWTKQVASDFGGTRNGMVIHWPQGINAKGEIRSQFGHVIDIAPTIYEITGIPAPKVVNGIEQKPIEGTSLAYTFNDAAAEEQHKVQYFEMFGNRAIYHDGWMARTIHRAPWQYQATTTLQDDVWELYNTKNDFSLANNLAAEYPEKLEEMKSLFMKEGEKYNVLPIDDRLLIRTNAEAVGRPTLLGKRNKVTYYEGMKAMGVDIFIDLRSKAYTMTADVEVDNNGNGVIVCQGGRFGGLSFYMKDGKPSFGYNFLGLETNDIVSSKALEPGRFTIVYTFDYDGGGQGKGGTGSITVNGEKVAEGRFERTQPGIFSVDDLADVGMDEGTWVTDYGKDDKFTGKIHSVTIERKE